MLTKKKAIVLKDPNCLNCGYPFTKDEKFCPECGQQNKGSRITFKSFMNEMFRGFFSWDAKFWRTLIPLVIKPGKVSSEYIIGKRQKYSNPFRFYLTVSILFFLFLSLHNSYQKLHEIGDFSQNESRNTTFNIRTLQDAEKDSISKAVIKKLKKSTIAKNIIPDSINTKNTNSFLQNLTEAINYSEEFADFQRANPDLNIAEGIEKLELENTMATRFWYSRMMKFIQITKNKNERDRFSQELLSLGSLSLFILLPLFTLSLKLIYIRKKYTYVEHLVFVFHIQTVFFLLLTLFFILDVFVYGQIGKSAAVFIPIFAVYLFMAMKKFYKQGFFKTFVKYCIANLMFFILTSFGIVILSMLVFAFF
ncbi:DUF3667 domain-containing protein [Tenacibaculum sp. SG-28]|uniref:DUF3667 domain-containing protein n=1 Tax=Tenacibaculum sp. SG-28 TaxID=754426 RepID=UPI000CF39878|nr:DUF3667 domain-containing protein [Tenacibaculum sp. SG-28]PQJ21189.1 hypothetical protein BSU00_09390 [Tenacibaculum sp. SG-28]